MPALFFVLPRLASDAFAGGVVPAAPHGNGCPGTRRSWSGPKTERGGTVCCVGGRPHEHNRGATAARAPASLHNPLRLGPLRPATPAPIVGEPLGLRHATGLSGPGSAALPGRLWCHGGGARKAAGARRFLRLAARGGPGRFCPRARRRKRHEARRGLPIYARRDNFPVGHGTYRPTPSPLPMWRGDVRRERHDRSGSWGAHPPPNDRPAGASGRVRLQGTPLFGRTGSPGQPLRDRPCLARHMRWPGRLPPVRRGSLGQNGDGAPYACAPTLKETEWTKRSL